MGPRLYFGHPINTYNTDLEQLLLANIGSHFRYWSIENPNQAHHCEGYQRYARDTGEGMKYFFNEVLPKCHGGVFLPFADGAWGTGVAGEARWLHDRHLPAWQIDFRGTITLLTSLRNIRVLTVEETRARIRLPNGDSIPY